MTATTVLRYNERLKLLAGALNNLSLAFVVAGVVAPVVNGTVASGSGRALVVVWLVFGVVLHGTAQWVLGRLR